MPNNTCFFGIDGGGTNSRLALTDREGRVLAGVRSGSTNIYSVTKAEAFGNVTELLDSALKIAGLKREDLAAGCIGSAGLGRRDEQALFREFFDDFLGPDFPVRICGDGEILLCGGLSRLEGYCLIAGTGAMALGRSASGGIVRSGGHGYMLGDEGSAAWIGKTAVARILRSLEGRDFPTNMQASILKAAGLARPDDFIRYVHHDADKAAVATLAPAVTDAARAGDPLALDILHTGAAELALLVKSVLTRSPEILRRELVIAGGVTEHNEIVVDRLKEILAAEAPDLDVFPPKGTALEGACLLAINEQRLPLPVGQ